MITKEELLLGTKKTTKIEIGGHVFEIRALSSGELAETEASHFQGMELEMNENMKRTIKIDTSKYLKNKIYSDHKRIALSITNEKWTPEEVFALLPDIYNPLFEAVNKVSGITDDTKKLMEEFRKNQ